MYQLPLVLLFFGVSATCCLHHTWIFINKARHSSSKLSSSKKLMFAKTYNFFTNPTRRNSLTIHQKASRWIRQPTACWIANWHPNLLGGTADRKLAPLQPAFYNINIWPQCITLFGNYIICYYHKIPNQLHEKLHIYTVDFVSWCCCANYQKVAGIDLKFSSLRKF